MMDVFLQNFHDIWTLSLLLAACIALPAGIIQGYAGFGGALFAVPFFALLFGPVPGFSIVVILMLFGQSHVFSKAIVKANWREVAPLVGPSMICITLGLLFFVSAEPSFIRRGMGIFVLFITVFMIFGWRYNGKRRVLVGVCTGSVAGGITGSFGVPAFPLSAIYFHSSASPPEIIRANVLAALACNLVVGIMGLSLQGVYTVAMVLQALFVGPVFIMGIYMGRYFFGLAPTAWYRIVTYGILICTALILLTS